MLEKDKQVLVLPEEATHNLYFTDQEGLQAFKSIRDQFKRSLIMESECLVQYRCLEGLKGVFPESISETLDFKDRTWNGTFFIYLKQQDSAFLKDYAETVSQFFAYAHIETLLGTSSAENEDRDLEIFMLENLQNHKNDYKCL